jgi:TonB family protein
MAIELTGEGVYTPGRTNFGLLPEPERSTGAFIVSAVVNGSIMAAVFILGMMVKHVIVEHHYEQTLLIAPTTPPPPPKIKVAPAPKLPPPPEPPKIKLEAPKIDVPKPKPEPKPIQMEAKLEAPIVKAAKPAIVLAPQPKAALTAAMPAQSPEVKPSTAPVHLGETFGVTPNPNATRPATIAAIGNPYGGQQGPAVAPHGVVGSTGIGDGLKSGSNAGVAGKVASAGIPGASGTNTSYGKVASAGIPATQTVAVVPKVVVQPASTNIELISKPPVRYTAEARQLKVQGDVILRVTFLANGQVSVQSVLRGLGHGLDEEAQRVAQQIRFRPATRDGHAVDTTTNITITFQLA